MPARDAPCTQPPARRLPRTARTDSASLEPAALHTALAALIAPRSLARQGAGSAGGRSFGIKLRTCTKRNRRSDPDCRYALFGV
eukprot:5488055-Prymnesium_polylepis.1